MPLKGIAQFYKGVYFLGQGFKLITQKQLRRYVVGPLLINIFMFSGIFYVALKYLITWIISVSPWSFIPGYLMFAVKILLGLLSGIVLCVGVGILSSILTNLVASGLNGFLCEAVYERVTAQKPPQVSFWTMTHRTVLRELQKLGYFLPRAIVVWVLYLGAYFVPVLNVLALGVLYAFGAWMVAVQYIDYPADLLHIKFSKVKQKLRSQKVLVLGFGTVTLLLLSIPIINCLAMPVAIAGATALWVASFSEGDLRDKSL